MKVQTKKVASNYLKLSKLRIVELLLITTVPSMVVSIYGFPPVELVLFTLFGGTALAVSANVLNQIFEIETDKLMARTSDRPLVVGTISVKNAYMYSILLALIGFIILYTQTTPLAAYIALTANIFYSFIYTLILKPRTNQNIVIGGAAGAAPVLIGWAATGTELDTGSWLLFLLVFLWTPAHFWALSIENVEDYRGASLLIAPVLQLGLIYLFLALIFGIYLMIKSYGLYSDKIKPISYFVFSNTYLAVIFLSMIADILFTIRNT